MPVRLLLVLAIATLSLALPAAHAEEPAAATAEDSQGRFQQMFTTWKEKLKEIRTVQVKYQDAPQQERVALHQQFEQLVREARAMVPELMTAAEQAFTAAPKQDEELTRFMIQIVSDHTGADNYEESLRLTKLLLDNQVAEPQLYLFGGVSAFATNEYELCEEYLKAAQEAGVLVPPEENAPESQKELLQTAMMYASMLPQYREMWAKEQQIRQAEAEADDLPRVKLETTAGDVVIELFENEAPIATANYISLIEKGFYDGLKFHRVIPGFMAQGGCPEGTGRGGPGYHIPCECIQPNHRKHFRGTLSMAHAGRNTGGSQFFLTFVPTPHLDGRHTAFGRVIEGFDVLAKIQRVDPSVPSEAAKADKIVKASVLRKRDHQYEPTKLPATR